MHTGMLWFDDSNCTLDTRILKGTQYYYKKYGKMPDLILVHPSAMDDGKSYDLELKGIGYDVLSTKVSVRAYRPVLPGHIWIGIEDKQDT